MRRVALYGGSFDPPHRGHIEIVKALKTLPFIDKVIVMPTFLNPFKTNFVAPAALRLKWLKEIFADDDKVEVSSFEVDQKDKIPTIDTVSALKKEYDKIYLVIGADNLASLHQWYRFDALQKEVTFIIATRDDIKVPKEYLTLNICVDISSSGLRQKVDRTKLPKKVASQIANYYKEHNEQQNTKNNGHTR
ncbi:nicotinate (nicotinamide) nucleotide adenylyltransferase [Sulfurimonas sp.]|uniref:nicotinate (nicotinamide) nucleotide adenylyltransferase n=1 Tax=Sulfurimonas sp. TaxID=2022749 RepID=UPI002619E6F8|nr:nicotinate (nicotinamide) nucleotide adenylyltransferase [Sulfurimonas sp.]